MIDIAVHELNKYYGSNHVIKSITFEINSGEKVGLLGRNGSGKTTLFKVIAEDEYYESGSVSKASGKNIGILTQIPTFGENDTVLDILYSSFKDVLDIHEAMKKIEGDTNSEVLIKYGKLMEEYERLGGYDIEIKIEKICNGMNINETMRNGLFSLLSGGEKTRVNLARILLLDCSILLLDEPTNHLDLDSLEWLEKFLCEFSGTVMVISHDRIFLDKTVTRIIEIDKGKANFYSGNYSFYIEERDRRYLTQTEQYKQQQRKINHIEAAIKRQRVWAQINPSNAGLAKRAKAMEKRIEQMEKVEKPTTLKRMSEEFNSGGYAAKEIVRFDSVNKRYGAKVLMENVSLTICRNDSIALIGENGCGKTTLIKMIMGEESSDSGIIKISSNAKIAYMSQIIHFDDENATVLETLRNVNGLPEDKVRSILAGFRFKAADVMKKVSDLSGGEKSRLKLCLLMQNKVNFLILDEPTNHLDIESREWIEGVVSEFEGTKLFISHDRYFLNEFASRIWNMKDGTITDFHGRFDELIQSPANVESSQIKAIFDKKKKSSVPKVKEAPQKLISATSIENSISEAEIELERINMEIEVALSKSDYHEMSKLFQEKQRLETEIEFLYSEWLSANQSERNSDA